MRLCLLSRLACRRPEAPPAGVAILGPTCLDISVAMHQCVPAMLRFKGFEGSRQKRKESKPTPKARQLFCPTSGWGVGHFDNGAFLTGSEDAPVSLTFGLNRVGPD